MCVTHDPPTIWLTIFSPFQIFKTLGCRNKFPEELKYLSNHYSLVPLFPRWVTNDRYDLFCGLPDPSGLGDGEFRRKYSSTDGEATFRIFECTEALSQSVRIAPQTFKGRLITFNRNQFPADNETVNYWYLQVPCNIIFFLFMKEADKLDEEDITKFTRPEILYARRIYERLKRVARFNLPL